ncbi:MAG: AsnC family transcriptional regulator [Alphaproteobacteria bacterium]|jgi:DNA-binding Lrp family transcriptional regulator|nr:AsnC family transcriptional regulator [Alphaproteobacteria bacterium]
MDATDRALVNQLHGGFPVTEAPFAEVGRALGLPEAEVITRLERLLEARVLTRFGPLYDAEAMGGAVTLAAMAVPAVRFEAVTEIVNGFEEVAHNYAREHALNMWFVVAAETPDRIAEVLAEIATATGLEVLDLPKEAEYFLELRLEA